MNHQEKVVLNVLKYGKPNPNWFHKAVSKIIGNGHFVTRNSSEFWQAIYHYQRASKRELIDKGYTRNSTVYSVVSLIAQTAAQAPWAIYRVKSTRAMNRLKSLQQQPYSIKRDLEIAIAKEDALEKFDSHYLNDVLLNPNEQQGQAEYMENLIGYKLITGDSYEYVEFQGEKSKAINSMWVAPSHRMKILTNDYGTFPMRELGYKLEVGSHELTYEPNQISHSKYWNPNFYGDGSHLYGFSPLEAAWLSTMQDNNAKEAAIEQLQNRGVRGIFTVESDKITEYGQFSQVKADLHNEWQQNSKNYKDKIMPLFGRGQWHNVGLSIKDLAIIELSQMNANDIYNVYHVPSILFNNADRATYENQSEARKRLITDCVLPQLGMIRAARNRKLIPYGDWNDSGERLVCDFDSTIYTELFDDVWEMAKDMRAVGAYTDNEIRIATNYERLEGVPMADEVWKKTNDIPLSLIKQENYGRQNRQENEAGRISEEAEG